MFRCAGEVTDGSQYFVLLIITDGVISDMVQTREAVVTVSLFHAQNNVFTYTKSITHFA